MIRRIEKILAIRRIWNWIFGSTVLPAPDPLAVVYEQRYYATGWTKAHGQVLRA